MNIELFDNVQGRFYQKLKVKFFGNNDQGCFIKS